jgi:tRNA (guanosine-2'-O-)-methyltransferase
LPVEAQDLLLERRRARIDQVVANRSRALTPVLEEVHDPHNLAAVLRTAEALGLQEVHAIFPRTGFRPNAAVTQGADKWIDLHRHKDAATCAAALRQSGYRLYASQLTEEAIPLDRLPFDQNLALIFGNEHEGVSPAFAALCDGTFRIPMYGFVQSFNVGVAVAIALSQGVFARRRTWPGGDLAPAEQEALRRRFYALAVKQGHRIQK